MKRRSKSTPRQTKRVSTVPGTPRPFAADLARDQLQRDFPGASPESTKKTAALRKQLFGSHMVKTRQTTMDNSSSSSSDRPLPIHATPPLDDAIEELPRAARAPAARDPPDIQDVLTHQTEVLAGMLAELRARQGPVPVVNAAEPPEDPDFDWSRLVMLPETSFQVPGTGQVQRMASSLIARVPTMAGRDQHEARFVLQVVSLWPDLHEEERFWAFQRLNVYCIVAALGWPQATAACASTSAATDFVLPPGVILPPAAAPRRTRRELQQPQQQQQQQPRQGQQQQQQRQQRQAPRNNNRRGRGGGAARQKQLTFYNSYLFLILNHVTLNLQVFLNCLHLRLNWFWPVALTVGEQRL